MKKVWAIMSSNKIIDFVEMDLLKDGEERLQRYSDLFSSNFFTKDITENKKVQLGSTWDGNSFSEHDSEISNMANHRFALVSDNKVMGIALVHTKARGDLYKDAEINGISALEITDMPFSDFTVGMTWDGTNFVE